jgi:hypothetical protein
VQPYLVPALRHLSNQARVRSGQLTDDEDGRSDLVPVQELHETFRHSHEAGLLSGVPPVVLKVKGDRERHLAPLP